MLTRLGLRPLLRFMSGGSHHAEPAAHHDHHAAEHHDEHGHHVHHSNVKIPEGSWHRDTDDEDQYYYYNKYGPFHSYNLLNQFRTLDKHNTAEEDPYRNTIQGYVNMADTSIDRVNSQRGILEFIGLLSFLMLAIGMTQVRSLYDGENLGPQIGGALVTAQEIEDFIGELKKRKNNN
ncbi:unnamed protein product [Blepharisma stoltei]|uniref:Uncharacterized protein n=1 Tax=Blepharisma stoltei TaxID=1481888 RepID=A0AAU9IW90_9CILI|nr:unnamed protein product [Blepharisma stoltei]